MSTAGQSTAKYLTDKVLPLMDALALAILMEQPENPETFLQKYLAERVGGSPAIVAAPESKVEAKEIELTGEQHLLEGVVQEKAEPDSSPCAVWCPQSSMELKDQLATCYRALQLREQDNSVETKAGASLYHELARIRLQLGDKKAAIVAYKRCRDILAEIQLAEISEGREVLKAIEDVEVAIKKDAAKTIEKVAQGRIIRKKEAKSRTQSDWGHMPPPLPLPPLEKGKIIAEVIAGGKIPVFLTGSNNHVHFTKRQKVLFKQVFRAMRDSIILQDQAMMIGASGHGRAPPGKFANWRHRGAVFDNIVQEEALRTLGNERVMMMTFGEQSDDYTIEGPTWKTVKLGPEDGVIHNAADLKEDVQGLTMRIQTPDTSALPGAQPQQWLGVQSLIRIALVLGGGPRAIQVTAERDEDTDCTKDMPDADTEMTFYNYPYKSGALFVLAAGGIPARMISANGPEMFKPPPVPEDVWSKLCDKDVVAFFAEQSEAELEDSDNLTVVNYADAVAKALEFLVQDAAQHMPRGRGDVRQSMPAMIVQANERQQAERDREELERIGEAKAHLNDFHGALSAYYKALQLRDRNNSLGSKAGATLLYELAGVRLQLGDKKAALHDYQRSRDILAKVRLNEIIEGRLVLKAIGDVEASIRSDAASVVSKIARRRLGRKIADQMKEASQTPPPLPLPPLGKAKFLAEMIAGDRIPVLLTGSNTQEFFTKRQKLLFKEVFRAMKDSKILQDQALMIGASAHGRAPPGRFANWPLRGVVFDNIAQEEAFRAMGNERTLMLTFGEMSGDFTIEGPMWKTMKLGPKDGAIHNSSDAAEDAEGLEMRIQTPDISALPGAEPQQWQGVKSLPRIALILGGGPRASQLAAERDEESDCTKEMIDVKAQLTLDNYPYKSGALFVLAAGGLPAAQIMASGPEMFKPPPVPEELWSRLCDKDVVAFFADKSDAELEDSDNLTVIDYANAVATALELLVQDSAQHRPRGRRQSLPGMTVQANERQQAERDREDLEHVGHTKAQQKDFHGALAAYYSALHLRDRNNSLGTKAGANLLFDLAGVRLQLGDKKAALQDYQRCRDILAKVRLDEINEGRDVQKAIKDLSDVIRHDAARLIEKVAKGKIGRKKVFMMREATRAPPPLPLPPPEKAALLAEMIAGDRIPVLLTGSNTQEFFTKRQKVLFQEVFNAMKESEILQDQALMIGASAHGRAPPGRFANWPLRGVVFDNIAQEEAFRAMGNERTLMLTFGEQSGDFTIEGPMKQTMKLGPKDGAIHNSSDAGEDAEGFKMRIQTPDISALPGAEPQQWQGVKSLPRIALVFGGGPRASQLAAERDEESDCTKDMLDDKMQLTLDNYPYKSGALFVLAAGGLPAAQIMASGPELFKPPLVPEELWQKLCDKKVVAFFADKSDAELEDSDNLIVVNYADAVAKALEILVNDAYAHRPPRTRKSITTAQADETQTIGGFSASLSGKTQELDSYKKQNAALQAQMAELQKELEKMRTAA